MNIRGAIFDMDGTLLDSMPMWYSVAYEYLVGKGLPAEPQFREMINTMQATEALAYFVDRYSLSVTLEQALREIDGLILECYQTRVPVKPGVRELLEWFRQAGIPMCVATATRRSLSEPALTSAGLLPYFKKIFTCAEVNASKEEPRIFLMAAEFLGTAPGDCPVFEDAPFALATAKNAGFFTVGVFDAFFSRCQQQVRAASDIYLKNFSDAAAILADGWR